MTAARGYSDRHGCTVALAAGRMAHGERLSPEAAPERACELAEDVRAAVLLDPAGRLVGSSLDDGETSEALAARAGELLQAVDAATEGEAPEQIEALVERGAVFVVRRPPWTLAAVARRSALSSLTFYDLRSVLQEVEPAS